VALAGKLEDVQPAEILQFLAMSEKTGKLTFTTGTQEGLIVFRQGKIIYAASSSLRETFGSIALSLQMVTEAELIDALLQQHRSGEDKRLGEILIEMEVLEQANLQTVLHHQVIQVLREMFGWRRGFFRFRSLDLAETGEVEVDARDLIVDSPIDARSLALDAARRRDEASRDAQLQETPPELSFDAEPSEDEQPEQTSLDEIINDVSAPVVTAENVKDIFDTAARVFSRGVIFGVQGHAVRGLAQFGLEEGDDPPSQRVRRLWLPIDQPSFIAHVVTRREAVRGAPDHNRWNETLFSELGGGWPDEAAALPVLVDGRIALVFYGDNEPDDLPVGSTAVVEEKLASVAADLVRSRDSS
jgi:hypothetical protein